MPKFQAALDSERIEAQVAADSAKGYRLGVRGTPTLFINGERLTGARPFEELRSAIDEELQSSER